MHTIVQKHFRGKNFQNELNLHCLVAKYQSLTPMQIVRKHRVDKSGPVAERSPSFLTVTVRILGVVNLFLFGYFPHNYVLSCIHVN